MGSRQRWHPRPHPPAPPAGPPAAPASAPHLGLSHLDEGAQRGLHVRLLPGSQQAEPLQQPQLGLAPGGVRVELTQQLLRGAHSVLLQLLPAKGASGVGRAGGPQPARVALTWPGPKGHRLSPPSPGSRPCPQGASRALTCSQPPGSLTPLRPQSRCLDSDRSAPCSRWRSGPKCCPCGLCLGTSGLRWAALYAYSGGEKPEIRWGN